MNKTVVVNFANGKGWYLKGQQRLKDSLGYSDKLVDFVGFTSETEVGSPPHESNPYAFKIYTIERVKSMGYSKILYVDSSVYAIKSIEPVIDGCVVNGETTVA